MSMSQGEYRTNMDILASLCRTMNMLPIEEMLEQVSLTETLAPALDPTAYQRGGADRLRNQRDLLTAAAGVKAAVARIARRNGIPEDLDA